MRDASEHLRQAPPHVTAGLDYAQLAPALYANVPLDLAAETAGGPVAVYANHGRWVVDCPDCNAAQLTHPSDPRFLCNVCGNVGNGRRFRPVIWPRGHEKLGELLDARADVELQNWLPGETVGDLRAENALLEGAVPLGQPSWGHPQWFDADDPHTHRYPKTLSRLAGAEVECADCGMPVSAALVQQHRDAEKASQ